jgi:hypothetical protein
MHDRGSLGRRAARSWSIEPGRIQAMGRIVNGSSAVGVVASDRRAQALQIIAQHEREFRDLGVRTPWGNGAVPLHLRKRRLQTARTALGIFIISERASGRVRELP